MISSAAEVSCTDCLCMYGLEIDLLQACNCLSLQAQHCSQLQLLLLLHKCALACEQLVPHWLFLTLASPFDLQ